MKIVTDVLYFAIARSETTKQSHRLTVEIATLSR